MTTLTFAQVYAYARQAGLAPAAAAIATAIAAAESSLNSDAVGDVALENATWGPSVGLWQIRSLTAQYGTGQDRDASRLSDPAFNARAMADISGMGRSWSAWSTYKNGAYKRYLTSATGASTATAADIGPLLPPSNNPGQTFTNGSGDGASLPGLSQLQAAASALNPFTGWQSDAQAIGLKLTLTLLASALAVAGVVRLVAPTVEKAAAAAGPAALLAL